MIRNIISTIVWILHLVLIIGVIASVFIPYTDKDSLNYRFKLWFLIFLIYLLFQYLTGYQKCGLTEFEYYIKKEKYQEGFLYRLIKPVITIPESYFEKYLVYIHILWVLILIYQLKLYKI